VSDFIGIAQEPEGCDIGPVVARINQVGGDQRWLFSFIGASPIELLNKYCTVVRHMSQRQLK